MTLYLENQSSYSEIDQNFRFRGKFFVHTEYLSLLSVQGLGLLLVPFQFCHPGAPGPLVKNMWQFKIFTQDLMGKCFTIFFSLWNHMEVKISNDNNFL